MGLRINKAILMHLIEAVWEFEFMRMQILLLYIVVYWKTLEYKILIYPIYLIIRIKK